MIELHAAGLTDVGQVRAGNEDSLHVGDSVFAVADGMGGHAAGEVASALALEPIARLDGRVFGDVGEAHDALEEAVVAANRSVVDAARDDDDLRGMGTTLTVALFEGRRLHVAHVGDSRAYLLRDGEVQQLTRDHTFVQQLIDDGSITEAEAETHPHRSVVTRAIGAREEVEIDLQSFELRSDDAVLLCSDGLSGVVPDETIGTLLASGRPPQEVVTELVAAANDAGGPDNITCVLLTVVNTPDGAAHAEEPETQPDADAPDAAEGGERRGGPLLIRPDSDAGPARALPGPGPDESIVVDPVERRRRIASIVVGIAVVLGLTLGAGRWLLSRSYFVGLEDQQVAIYQGIPVDIGPLSPNWVVEETSLTLDDVPSYQRDLVDQGMAATSRSDARTIVAALRAAGEAEDAEELQDQVAPGGDGTPSPSPSPTAGTGGGDGAATSGSTAATDDPTDGTTP